ncbi:DEAD/DEAH box helicase [Christiangramia salexigens]|uniref:DEAD/DEAH box helicase n=1 Tax=Christiangramia salexigens TaxID=1913577 RepID=A0A1L3J456_9FLAO|nr:DEAD/DEAH box helicase [Christiangramia salexigens]APG59915.1 DEAD/DEAH box helicase [Christiangramia salexigens]
MSFKKLNEHIKERLSEKGFDSPTPFQKKALPVIKSGADLYGIAPEGAGKTTAMIISVIHKLEARAFEDSPRALIYVKDKEAALDLEEKFQEYIKGTDLRVYTAYEEHSMDTQKDEIYYGVDIVIATPRRLGRLFSNTGIHLGQLKMVIVEDAEFLSRGNHFNEVIRIPQSIAKCQYIILGTKMEPKMKRLQESFMELSRIVKA